MADEDARHTEDADPDGLAVVYTAASATEAGALVNLLAEAGIRAVVSNAVLEGGAGVDLCGWPTAARVAVAQQNALAAREIALEFDRTVATRRSSPPENVSTDEVQPVEATAGWPRCPACDVRRTTRCPICSTEGTDFRQADPQYSQALGIADDAAPLETCACGGGSCHGREPSDQAAHQGDPGDCPDFRVNENGTVPFDGRTDSVDTEIRTGPDPAAEEAAGPVDGASPSPQRLTLLCPTCDEPFVPQYARRCAACGHEFDEGYEADEPREAQHLDYRVLVLLGLVLAVLGALLWYFAAIVPGS